MSTLTSADFNIKRPTTRVHAPPGGGSSWSIGGDDSPAPPHRGKRNAHTASAAAAASAPAPAVTAADIEMDVPVDAVMPPTRPQHPAGTLRVALVKTKADAEIVDVMTQNALEKLQTIAHVSAETFAVANLEDLPYAANKLTQYGGFDAVIALGFLHASHPLFSVLAATLAKAFIDISVKNDKPVVRGLFIGEPRTASVKAKGGLGAEFADGIDALIRLGN